MQSSLAAQLEHIAAASTNTLNTQKLKSIHATSLLFPPAVAATQDLDTVYFIALEGFRELCLLDEKFVAFERGLFSESSRHVDRFMQTKDQVKELDASIEAFLQLVSGRLLLKPALKAVEWLVRRFRVQDQNTTALVLAFLPYHTHQSLFPNLLSIISAKDLSRELVFLRPYLKSPMPVPRHVITHTLSHRRDFYDLLTSYTISTVRAHRESHVLLSFFAAVSTEAVSLMCDGARSTRAKGLTEEDVLQRTLPVLEEAYRAKKAPEFQIGAYMITTIVVSKIPMNDQVLTALMAGIVASWTSESLAPALACIALIAQARVGPDRERLPEMVVKTLMKVDTLEQRLVAMGRKYKVDKLVVGVCHGIVMGLGKMYGAKELKTVVQLLEEVRIGPKGRKSVLSSLVARARELKGFEGKPEEEEAVRDLLASTFLGWAEQGGKKLGKALNKVLKDDNVDVEMLELALRTVIRPRQIEAALDESSDTKMIEQAQPEEEVSLDQMLERLPPSSNDASFLAADSPEVFAQLRELFLLAVRSTKDLHRLMKHPIFAEKPKNSVFGLSFLAKMWTTSPTPVVARAAAIKQATAIVKKHTEEKIDFQALIPLLLVALADPAERVRHEASSLASAIQASYKHIEASSETGSKRKKSNASAYWALNSLYGTGVETEDVKWLDTAEAKKFVDLVIVPGLQECVMDGSYAGRLLQSGLSSSKAEKAEADKKDTKRLRTSVKTSVLSFLSSHAVSAPGMLIKLRLLILLNHIAKAPTSRTRFLLPLLQAWIVGDREAQVQKCAEERVSLSSLEQQIVGVVANGEKMEGLQPLLDILAKNIGGESLVSAVATHIISIWPTLKSDTKTPAAESLLETALAEEHGADPGRAEAMGVLRDISMPSESFHSFLNKARGQIKTSLSDGTSKAKRRRTSVGGNIAAERGDEVALAIRRITVIAELLESQGAQKHATVLQKLFEVLGDVGSVEFAGITYLQSVLLACMRDIINSYKTSGKDLQSEHTIRADVLVSCIRSTTSPQIQNNALLLLASLADVAPDVVKHSVMPIFTFMGASTLRQDDEYSAHVIEQTVQRVIPPLVKSLQEQGGSPVVGAADLVTTFVASYRHVPTHRRLRLFASLIDTLGADEFLFALIAKLAARYNTSDQEGNVADFATALAGGFAAETQMITVAKYLNAVTDVLEPAVDGISQHLFGGEQETKELPAQEMAQRLLAVLKSVLSGERLRAKVSRSLKTGGEDEKTKLRGLFSQSMERILALGEKYMREKPLRLEIAAVLEHLLELLSTTEFIAVIETLLSRPEPQFRRSALATFKLRVLSESRADAASRNAILSLTPKIAAIISSDAEAMLKSDALSCLDAVTTKFGKQKPDAVAALADSVTGPGALRSTDDDLRVLALVCLTSMTTALGGRIVPVLPKTVPFALELLKGAVETENELTHNAVLVYLDELCKTVPSFMNSYLSKMLPLLAASVACDEFQDGEAPHVRAELWNTIASRLEAKAMVAAAIAAWSGTVKNGVSAVQEQIDAVKNVIAHATKGTVQKHHQLLLTYFLLAFDARNSWSTGQEDKEDEDEDMDEDEGDEEVDELEDAAIATAINMVYKLNDSIFKPMFLRIVEWAVEKSAAAEADQKLRRMNVLWKLLGTLSDKLKSLVTDYYAYVLEPATTLLNCPPFSPSSSPSSSALHTRTWTSLLAALKSGFAADDRDFWQSPTHYQDISASLLSQLDLAAPPPPSSSPADTTTTASPTFGSSAVSVDDITAHVIPALVELAAASQSEDHFKAINSALCRKMRDEEHEGVRLVAVRTLKELYARLGEEWLPLLPETVPFVAEGLEDESEAVEKEVRLLVVKVEELIGEGELQSMLT